MGEPRQEGTGQGRLSSSLAVAVLLPDGFSMASLGVATDVLGYLSRQLTGSGGGPAISCRLLGPGRAASFSGITVAAEQHSNCAASFDLVFIPDVEHDMLDSGLPRLDGDAIAWLREQYDAGAVVAVDGASSLILAEAGLVRNRELATAGWARSARARRCGRLRFSNKDLVEDGDLYSSSGVGTNYEFVLFVLRRWLDPAMLDRLADEFRLLARSGCQTTASDEGDEQGDVLVDKARNWIDRHYASNVTLGGLARQLAVSEKTLGRHFRLRYNQTPIDYLQFVRINKAQEIIRTLGYGTSRTAEMVGYRNVRFFSRLFRERVGIGPKEYRLHCNVGALPVAE